MLGWQNLLLRNNKDLGSDYMVGEKKPLVQSKPQVFKEKRTDALVKWIAWFENVKLKYDPSLHEDW